jgi:D-alanyl-D-alanine carboxypeptidase-like protein
VIDVSYPGTAGFADRRGWGPGWPNPQSNRWVPLRVRDVDFPGGVREEIRGLCIVLLEESESRGWVRLRPGWCWGAANRAIKSSDGSATNTPSNHSWGLAIDINAPENVYGSSHWAIPTAMARLWNRYGFRWGGDYPHTKDPMHFEFMGKPTDVRALTRKAKEELTDVSYQDFRDGGKAFRAASTNGRDPGPPPNNRMGNPDFVYGWSLERSILQAEQAVRSPTPTAHRHRLADLQRHRHRQPPTTEAEAIP